MDAYYRFRYSPSDDRAVVWPEIVRFLSDYVLGAEAVLDLGAGYCDFVNRVPAPRRIAVDLSPTSAAYAGPGVEHLRTPASDLHAIATGAMDVVFSSNLLEHFDDSDIEAAIGEVRRVLRPRGILILMQPNYRLSYRTYFDDPTHRKVFSDTSMRVFLSARGFEVVNAWPRFLPFSLSSRPPVVPLSRMLVRAYLNSPWKPFAGQMLFVARRLDSNPSERQ